MKLPNGYGSIKHLSGRRRNPYAVYYPVTEWNDKGYPILKPLGYYRTYHEAMECLNEYNRNPYDPASRQMTFKEVYELWHKAKFEDSKKKLSRQSIVAAQMGFNHTESLHNRVFASLRTHDFQKVLDDCPLKHASLEVILSTIKGMGRYAIEHEIVSKDYTQFAKILIPDDDEKGEAISDADLDILWANSEDSIVKVILIMIYSGFRIKAFETIKIDIDNQTFTGGVKTSAGKNRTVPICPLIKDFVTNDIFNGFKADSFRNNKFHPKMSELGLKHYTPHDCRHTFSYLCDKYKIDPIAKRMMLGHTLGTDVTDQRYGHRTLDDLRREIAKMQK